GLDLLKKILATLPSRINQELILKPALAYIDKVYLGIRGTNVVVTGTVKQGMFKPEQKVKIGPDENGEFFEGRIATVEVFKERVQRVKAGDIFGFDVKRIDPKKLRRGQVISDVDMELRACHSCNQTPGQDFGWILTRPPDQHDSPNRGLRGDRGTRLPGRGRLRQGQTENEVLPRIPQSRRQNRHPRGKHKNNRPSHKNTGVNTPNQKKRTKR
ncbi:MAG: EF-Tu/IF-2/RF-3 family GTPase, partial [Candidatus Freyarchaeota archaeon]